MSSIKKPITYENKIKQSSLKVQRTPLLYSHAESNRNRQNRNLKFYPLNYRSMTGPEHDRTYEPKG